MRSSFDEGLSASLYGASDLGAGGTELCGFEGVELRGAEGAELCGAELAGFDADGLVTDGTLEPTEVPGPME